MTGYAQGRIRPPGRPCPPQKSELEQKVREDLELGCSSGSKVCPNSADQNRLFVGTIDGTGAAKTLVSKRGECRHSAENALCVDWGCHLSKSPLQVVGGDPLESISPTGRSTAQTVPGSRGKNCFSSEAVSPCQKGEYFPSCRRHWK
jgi:hypothetical protein